jgi:hypothetical protein
VLLIAATACTAILAFLVQFGSLVPFGSLMALMAFNALLALAAAPLWTAMTVYQADTYSALIAPTATDAGHGAPFGPGFYMIWLYFLCTLMLTHFMAHFTALMVLQALVVIVLFAALRIAFMMIACAAHERTVQEERAVAARENGNPWWEDR